MSDDTRKEAVEACRQWAKIRVLALVFSERDPDHEREVAEFDKQMFRLGEQVFTSEGEVTNVERL